MKKYIFSALLIVMLILSACSMHEPCSSAVEDNYIISEKTGDNGIPILYVSNMKNSTIERKINIVLSDSMYELVKDVTDEWLSKIDLITVSAKYKGTDFLSILYELHNKDVNDDYRVGYGRMGITISIQTGERVFLDEFVNDIDELYSAMSSYVSPITEAFPPVTYDQAEKVYYSNSVSELEYIHSEWNYPWASGEALSIALGKPCFYLFEGNIVIVRDAFDLHDVVIPRS